MRITRDPSHAHITNQAHVLITAHASTHTPDHTPAHTPDHTPDHADTQDGIVQADIHTHDLVYAHGHSHPDLIQTFRFQQGFLAPVET